jgi:ankyrin repeat protein
MEPYEEFSAAILAGDTARAAGWLRQYPEWKERLDQPLPGASFGSTALLTAVGKGNRELIDVLLAAGASIDARSRWWAGGFGVLDNDGDLAGFLIERGATVDAHAAARLGRSGRLRELLDADPALVHARGGDGQTPLHVAANVEIAELLVDRGADMDARDIDHESTAAQYLLKDHPDVARYLVARGCHTDILMAAALGLEELVRRHLDATPEAIRLNVSTEHFPMRDPRAGGTIYIWTLGWFQTPHSLARQYNHDAVFNLLMERSPAALRLAVACELADDTAAQALLAQGVVPAPEDHLRLPRAAQNNRAGSVRLLLRAGWPPEVRAADGVTALHWAAWHGNVEAVRVLLEHRAPLDLRDAAYSGAPLDWARHGQTNSWHRASGNYPAVIELLGG